MRQQLEQIRRPSVRLVRPMQQLAHSRRHPAPGARQRLDAGRYVRQQRRGQLPARH
jgi:hypothetical protein